MPTKHFLIASLRKKAVLKGASTPALLLILHQNITHDGMTGVRAFVQHLKLQQLFVLTSSNDRKICENSNHLLDVLEVNYLYLIK